MLSALGELKNSSKTGASGMGALSESEGQILEKSLGNLDQSQTANELRRNLLRLKERLLKSSDNLTKALNADYGEYIAQDNAAPNQQQVSGQMAQPRNATPAQVAPAAGNVDYESMANDYLKSIGIQ